MVLNNKYVTDKNKRKVVEGELFIKRYNHVCDEYFWDQATEIEFKEERNWQLFHLLIHDNPVANIKTT